MLKRMFALSNQGSRDLNKGIAATTLSNLCLIAPVSLLVMVIWELLNVISGQESSMRDHAALFICGTVVMFIIVFLTQWLQYNKTYTVAYKESANRRIVLAEKLRKLPLSFFGQRDLSDLTTTIMGDCTALERVFSNACLLYTSDAADEEDSVDLGGRAINKKKKKEKKKKNKRYTRRSKKKQH